MSAWLEKARYLAFYCRQADQLPSVSVSSSAPSAPQSGDADLAQAFDDFASFLAAAIESASSEDIATSDLVTVAKLARHFGYREQARALLSAALTRDPLDVNLCREFWVEVSTSGLDLDEDDVRGPQLTYLLGAIRDELNRLAVRHYAISFHESGFGDQMMTASVSAKLAEMLGLTFLGVVDLHVTRHGRIGALFEGEKTWFELIFASRLSLVAHEACRELVLDGSLLATALIQLLRDLQTREPPVGIVTFVMGALTGAELQPQMWDRRGGLLENAFTTLVREAACAERRMRAPSTGRGRLRLALHLRIGDVANVPLVKPGYLLIPHAVSGFGIHVEAVAEQDIGRHHRRSRVPFFLDLAERCSVRFGRDIEMHVATDGYARILASLEREEYLDQLRAAAGHDFDVASVREHFREQDGLLRSLMSNFAVLHYGEQPSAFLASIDAIGGADVIVTTSGQFAPSIANFLNEPGSEQTVFTFHRDIRFMLSRKGVSLRYLGTDDQINRELIEITIAERVGSAWPLEAAV